MATTTAILLGLLLSFVIIYVILNIDKFIPRKKYKHQDLIDTIHSRIAKANGAAIDQFSLENLSGENKENVDAYKNATFVNKHCTNLEDFIINDEISAFDLKKLADLNGIKLQISGGWYPLTIELIKELHHNGWDKKVSCIKEKYASLRFYTKHAYGSPVHKIIDRYEKKSEYVCETCGEKGKIRHNSGWDYVACRKHYLENRGKITVEDAGFNHNGNFYSWNEVKDASFKDLDYYEKYKFLILEFRKAKIRHQGWIDNKLYISGSIIGFGNFLNHLPKTFESLNRDYLRYFENPGFCAICGYKAVYFGKCECCENDSWVYYTDKWKGEENTEESKYEYLKYHQICWAIDEGEMYESKQNNYSKNPDHKILFTETELKEYEEIEDDDF